MKPLPLLLTSLAVFALALALPAAPGARAAPAAECWDSGTTLVNTLDDSGGGSLRAAIDWANATPGPNQICFASGLKGVIGLQSDLPAITDDGTTIDASSNWSGNWPTGDPGITLAGTLAPSSYGLRVSGAQNFAVKGLAIEGFAVGIRLENGASHAVIGSPGTGGRMLVRSNSGDAVQIVDSSDNKVLGSYIGTSNAGNLREPNGGSGIYIFNGQRNQIGGSGQESNLIGSNALYGVDIHGSNAISNTVIGNSIGIGTLNGPITNTLDGIHISGGASMNGIGGIVYRDPHGWLVYSPTLGNTIYGSGRDGVGLEDASSVQNGIMVSKIDDSVRYGIYFDGASVDLAGQNTVTHSGQSGIQIDNGASTNWIVANWVGTDQWGNTGLGNGHHAIAMYSGARDNTVDSNVAVASGWSGIVMVNPDTQFNWLVWNKIGVGPQGQTIGNGYYGVSAVESPYNALTANEIAHNGGSGGVYFTAPTAIGNSVFQNSIHDNGGPGIRLENGANHDLPAPAITSAACPLVRGIAPPNTIVQLFSDQADEGATYEGRTTADPAGNWSLSTQWKGPHLTATASLTMSVTSGAAPSVGPAVFAAPGGARTRPDQPAQPAITRWDSSAFSSYVASGGCRLLFLPLIRR